MATGLSLHIGLNSVDPGHYSGWSGDLNACEADARDMLALAKAQGFVGSTLLTRSATRARFVAEVQKAAAQLASGDFFFLSYSGHGGQVPDLNADEGDKLDETWCLFDGQFIDDEVELALAQFAAGVRICVLADSCHSGTSTKEIVAAKYYALAENPHKYRNMPGAICFRVYMENKDFYDAIAAETELKLGSAVLGASVILISGCQDSQLSGDGIFNGVFTGALKSTWRGGAFRGNYREFKDAVVREINQPDQVPNLFVSGAANPAFEAQRPFTI